MTAEDADLAERLRGLGDQVMPVEDEAILAARKKRIVERMEGNLREVAARRLRRSRQQRVIGVLAVLVAAAAALAVVRFAPRKPATARLDEVHGSVHLRHGDNAPMTIASPISLAEGDEVTIDVDGNAHITSAIGASIAVESASVVRAISSPDSGEGFLLLSGRVEVEVPKLGPHGSFHISTSDADVVVHGTAFQVSACDRCGGDIADTRVRVTEGVVSVRHAGIETLVRAGEVWPSPETAAALPTDSAASKEGVAPPLPSSSARAASSARSGNAVASAAPEASSLAAQNALLQNAFAAKRRGDSGGALRMLDELLAKYPSSPLAQEARVERLRCLESMGKSGAAAAEARRYLVDYPDGFARDEAKAQALPPAASASSGRGPP